MTIAPSQICRPTLRTALSHEQVSDMLVSIAPPCRNISVYEQNNLIRLRTPPHQQSACHPRQVHSPFEDKLWESIDSETARIICEASDQRRANFGGTVVLVQTDNREPSTHDNSNIVESLLYMHMFNCFHSSQWGFLLRYDASKPPLCNFNPFLDRHHSFHNGGMYVR